METWSEKHSALSPGVSVQHAEDGDGWFEHEYSYMFRASNHEEAKRIALDFVDRNPEGSPMEVWSLYSEDAILTEQGEER